MITTRRLRYGFLTTLLLGIGVLGSGCRPELDQASLAGNDASLEIYSGLTPVAWKSERFSAGIITDPARGIDVVAQIFRDPGAEAEVKAYIEAEGGLGDDSKLWDVYLGPYDRVTSYSDGYRALVADAVSYMPKSGNVIDYGAGTASFSNAVLRQSLPAPCARHVVAVDISPLGSGIGDRKMELADPSKACFKSHVASLLPAKATDKTPHYDYAERASGGIINNVIYNFSDADKIYVLGKIFAQLEPGAPLYLNEPRPGIQTSETQLESDIMKVVQSAISNGAPLSSYDIALVTAINKIFLTQGNPSYVPLDSMKALVERVGFAVEDVSPSTYYGVTYTLKLRKPR